MKKILAAAMLALAIPCVAMAAKPVNSQKLLDDPGRFAVVYVSDDERVYADMDTVERDPVPAGDLPIIRGKLYAEVYKDPLSYPDYGNYQMVDKILQYDTAVGADQFGPSTIRYRILNKLENVYDSDGNPSTYMGKQEDPADDAEEIYMSLYRLTRGSNL